MVKPEQPEEDGLWNNKLGTDHTEAVGYMSETKEEMEVIMAYVQEVQNDPATDTLELCYTDTKRAVAMQAGYDVFDAIDSNGDGALTPEEVSSYFGNNPQLIDKIFSAKSDRVSTEWIKMIDMLDVNGDKEVSWEEFAEFWTDNGLDISEGAELFGQIDNSQDGTLCTRELKKYLLSHEGLRNKLSMIRVQRLHKEWDAFFAMLHDGTNGSLDRTQFASLWSASGLGLNILKEKSKGKVEGDAAEKVSEGGEEAKEKVKVKVEEKIPSPPKTARRPMSPLAFSPTPPSRSAPSTARGGGSGELIAACDARSGTYLTRDAVQLERPCVAKRVCLYDLQKPPSFGHVKGGPQ